MASMICRDELDRYLPDTIDRLLDFCDEIMVLDDGSTDGTREWLVERSRERRKRILVLRNEFSLWDKDGEGAARGQLLDFTLARQPSPDWILSIDADEWVSDGLALRRFLEEHDPFEVPTAVTLRMVEVWSRHVGPTVVCYPENAAIPAEPRRPRWGIRVDGEWGPREVPVVWTPPHRKLSPRERWEYGWTIPNRRLACGREPECIRLVDGLVATGVDLCHMGWSDYEERRDRALRYQKLDGGRYHASEHLRSILAPPTLEPYPAP